MFEAAKINCVW